MTASAGVSLPKVAKWIPPPTGYMKVNVDGAIAKTEIKGGVGAICRDEQGRFLGASAAVYEGISEPATLEAYACREALELAGDLNIQRIMVASDCLNVITEIKSGSASGRHCMILRDIQQRRSDFQETMYGHEQREANGEAHIIARMATTLASGRHVWLIDPPDHLCIPMNLIQ